VLTNFSPDTALARLGQGAQGDVVVWAQEHLARAGQPLVIDGAFGAKTRVAVLRFQRAHGLPTTGLIATATWQALLRYPPASVSWTSGGARAASVSGTGLATPVPRSAHLPARRNEIAGAGGAGVPH